MKAYGTFKRHAQKLFELRKRLAKGNQKVASSNTPFSSSKFKAIARFGQHRRNVNFYEIAHAVACRIASPNGSRSSSRGIPKLKEVSLPLVRRHHRSHA